MIILLLIIALLQIPSAIFRDDFLLDVVMILSKRPKRTATKVMSILVVTLAMNIVEEMLNALQSLYDGINASLFGDFHLAVINVAA